MQVHKSSELLHELIARLYRDGNSCDQAIHSSESDSNIFIFTKPIPQLWLKELMADANFKINKLDKNFIEIAAKGSGDRIQIPYGENMYQQVMHIFKSLDLKSFTSIGAAISIIAIGIGFIQINSCLRNYQISFLFQSVINYIGVNTLVFSVLIIGILVFLYAILAMPLKSPLVAPSSSPKKDIFWPYFMYAMIGIVYAIFLAEKLVFSWSSLIGVLAVSSTVGLLGQAANIKNRRACFLEFMLLNFKYFVALFLLVFILQKLVPQAFHGTLPTLEIVAFTALVLAWSNVGAYLKEYSYSSKLLSFLPTSSFILSIMFFVCLVYGTIHQINLINGMFLGGYTQSLLVDKDLQKYPAVLRSLGYRPGQPMITPWIILQTDKDLVIARDENSKLFYYFGKRPYVLISVIDLQATNQVWKSGSSQ